MFYGISTALLSHAPKSAFEAVSMLWWENFTFSLSVWCLLLWGWS